VARAVALATAVPGVTRVDSSLRVGADQPQARALPVEGAPVVRDPAVEFAELGATPGRFAIGGSFVTSRPSAAAFEPSWAISPLVRLGAGNGLGAAAIFDWYGANVAGEPGSPESRLRVRPLMAGVRYTATLGRVAVSPSLVGGYAFNRIIIPDTGAADRLAVDAENSLVWRPGVALWIDAGRRTVVNLSVGRMLTRLTVTFVEAGVIEQRTVSGDATTVSIGLVYRLF
jgi:hypothetical protein